MELPAAKLDKVMAVFNSPALQSAELRASAARTGFAITPHLVYRYLESTDFADKYPGKPVTDAIVETVRWREAYGVMRLGREPSVSLLSGKGMSYTSDTLDKLGRAIIYVKIGRNDKMQSNDAYLQHMMYTTERADRMCAAEGSGEFITIADLAGLSWSTCPPMGVLKDAITLLKSHYPYRLGGVFILNAPALFHWIWKILKPFMPPKALKKTFLLDSKEMATVLNDKVGLENLEEIYGGRQQEMKDVDAYLQAGYWERAAATRGEGAETVACVVNDQGACV